MDYREALMKLSDEDLKYIHQQVFHEQNVEDLHRIELIESIRKEVLSEAYIRQMLTVMPEEEYAVYMKAVKNKHEFIPIPAERMLFSLQFLMLFESKKGLELPSDLIEEINHISIAPLEENRAVVVQGQNFISGSMLLYGIVHKQHLANIYQQYFNEPLSQEMLDLWIEAMQLEQLEDLIMMPGLIERLPSDEIPAYHPENYYVPASFEELSTYAASHHHDSEGLHQLLNFMDHHLPEDMNAQDLKEMTTFLIASTLDANATMETLIDIFAKNLSEDEFEQFEALYIKALETTRMWAYGGKTVKEAAEEQAHRVRQEEREKEKKVIDIDVFRHE